MRRIIGVLTVSLVASGAFGQLLPPRASLALLPSATLPGLPVGFLVTFVNPAAQPQQLSEFARLTVTTAAGTFSAKDLRGDLNVHLPTDQMERCGGGYCLSIPPNGQRQLYIRFGPELVENEFFADTRLGRPGRYDLQLAFSIVGTDGTTAAVITDSQILLIQQPTGVDLAVWNLLQQISGGATWTTRNWIEAGDSVASRIRALYPSSGYAPWVAGIGALPNLTPAAKLQQIDTALTNAPPAALRDELLLAKASLLKGLSEAAIFTDRDADTAVALANQARSVFTQLKDAALTDYSRNRAADALRGLLTRSTAIAEVEALAQHDPPAPERIIPRVECIRKETGQAFTVRFGYTNPNRVMKVLQIGPDNQVTPAPRDAGQPRVFKPGNYSNVFTASSPGGVLRWQLDGSTITATAGSAPPCDP